MKSNRLCELLGIEYPIIQAPMNWITGAELASAASNAGLIKEIKSAEEIVESLVKDI